MNDQSSVLWTGWQILLYQDPEIRKSEEGFLYAYSSPQDSLSRTETS